MPSISYEGLAAWSNYHLTIGARAETEAAPHMVIEELGRIYAADTSDMDGIDRFGATARQLLGHVARLEGYLRDMKMPSQTVLDAPFAAGTVGSGWSFTGLVGTPISQLLCEGLAGIALAKAADLHPHLQPSVGEIALISGGTRLREIVNWAEARGLSIPTSGTHLGPTIAGGFGTASHGSRLGFGGLQNMIHGMHLITGSDRHIWIDRKSSPALSDEALARLSVDGLPVTLVRDDDRFEDALVHLGGMGIVNGVALSLRPTEYFTVCRNDRSISKHWLRQVDSGAWQAIARSIGVPTEPSFYELTLDPHAPFGEHCFHTFYVPAERPDSSALLPAQPILTTPDAISGFAAGLTAEFIRNVIETMPNALVTSPKRDSSGDPDPEVGQGLRWLFRTVDSCFAYYGRVGQFEPHEGDFDLDKLHAESWGEIHKDIITGDIPGALYNASFAIPRERTSSAVMAICEAVKDLEPSFVFTLRFVSNPHGSLAFTRFEENTVIEIDGLSPLFCRLQAAQCPDDDRGTFARRMLTHLAQVLPLGAARVRKALEDSSIDYSMHWAKLGELSAAKVLADFGVAANGQSSLIRQWRETRELLLTPSGQKLFWNDALIDYGLLNRPKF